MTTKYIEPTSVQEWADVPNRNDVALTLQQIRSHANRALRRNQPAMIVFGGSGMGKNFIVENVLKQHRLKPVESSPRDYRAFLDDFHEATAGRKRNPLPIICNEAKVIFETERNLNILKLATDEPHRRHDPSYHWITTEEVEDKEGNVKLKKIDHYGVSLDAPLLIMTNKRLKDYGRKVEDDLKALFSRVPPIHIPDDRMTCWEYTAWLSLASDLITNVNGKPVPLDLRAAALDWFTDNVWNLEQVSPRVMQNVIRIMRTSDTMARDLDTQLVKRDERVYIRPPQKSDWKAIRIALCPTTPKAKTVTKKARKAPKPAAPMPAPTKADDLPPPFEADDVANTVVEAVKSSPEYRTLEKAAKVLKPAPKTRKVKAKEPVETVVKGTRAAKAKKPHLKLVTSESAP